MSEFIEVAAENGKQIIDCALVRHVYLREGPRGLHVVVAFDKAGFVLRGDVEKIYASIEARLIKGDRRKPEKQDEYAHLLQSALDLIRWLTNHYGERMGASDWNERVAPLVNKIIVVLKD